MFLRYNGSTNESIPVPTKPSHVKNQTPNTVDETPSENEENHHDNQSFREQRDYGHNQSTKNYNKEEVVLVMDSNMNFIDEKKFSYNMKTFKLKCGKAEILQNKLELHELSNASHIIVGTGTNDIQDGADAQSIFRNLKNAVEKLSSSYKANIHLAQLPPMKGEKNVVVSELNSLIKSHSPKDVNIIVQEDLTIADLYDTKHVSIKSLGKFVKNIKDGLRAVRGKRNGNRQHSDLNRSAQRHVFNDREERPQRNRDRPGEEDETVPTQHNMFELFMKAMQKSHKNLIHEMRDSFKMSN